MTDGLHDDTCVPAYLLDQVRAEKALFEEVLQEFLLAHAAGGDEQRPICWCKGCTKARHVLGVIKQRGMRNRIPPGAREQIKQMPRRVVPA